MPRSKIPRIDLRRMTPLECARAMRERYGDNASRVASNCFDRTDDERREFYDRVCAILQDGGPDND